MIITEYQIIYLVLINKNTVKTITSSAFHPYIGFKNLSKDFTIILVQTICVNFHLPSATQSQSSQNSRLLVLGRPQNQQQR